jgi:hypothetical protein
LESINSKWLGAVVLNTTLEAQAINHKKTKPNLIIDQYESINVKAKACIKLVARITQFASVIVRYSRENMFLSVAYGDSQLIEHVLAVLQECN